MLGTVANAEFAGTLLECGVYGLYMVMFVRTLHVFYKRHREGRDVRWLLAVCLVIFALVTARLGMDTYNITMAHTQYPGVPNAASKYYAQISKEKRLARTTPYIILTLISDGIIVHRTFIVWSRSYSVSLFPFVLFLADIALSTWEIWSLAQLRLDVPLMQAIVAYHIKYFYVVTLMLNLSCTSMIAWKIWRIHRKVAAAEPAIAHMRFRGVLAAVIESAAIYTCWLAALVGTSIVRSPNTWIVLDSICPVIGMVFSTVIVHSSRECATHTWLEEPVSDEGLGGDACLSCSQGPPVQNRVSVADGRSTGSAPRQDV